MPSFLNGTTTLTASLVAQPMLPCTSLLATPAVAWATPALTPFTLPALYVITSVSDDTYVTPAVAGYLILEGIASSLKSSKSLSDNVINLVQKASE